jgi:transcriptional antiterminator NusG
MTETTENAENIENSSERKQMKGAKWYALRVVTGKEKKAIEFLESELRINNCERFVNEILLPQEDEMKMRNGKKFKRSRITMPGYLFIECKIIGEVENTVRRTNMVADWVRDSAGKPEPLKPREMDKILGRIEETKKGEVPFIVGETVRIIDGPFSTFNGTIEHIDENKNHLKVNVMVFGRPTPVDLSFLQVEREK